ncbi:saccharopine dehydrogenase [Actinophytocola sp.]|uniref:saccharopine dehydrogenase n=1 Tax=Actinophytocola sp. TaxID=1872138 RepID=UPI002ED51459
MSGITVRHEVRDTERRAPIVPADAARLVAHGITVTVEESAHRVFPVSDYADAGCRIAPAGSWLNAPDDEYVVGLKELPDLPPALRHRHVYFGHAYKGQRGARDLLRRFVTGGGALLDLEYLVDDDGRRVAAFGYWAGYIGAALAVLHHRDQLTVPLVPTDKESLDALLRDGSAPVRALVVGALGRSGRGACDAMVTAGIEPTRWDLAETRSLDLPALLDHDILVNAVLVTGPTQPFLTTALLRHESHRLSLVADVTCDVTSEWNVLPIYDETTTWTEPVMRPSGTGVDVIAIDNLPSLLPKEASLAFSAELTPHLQSLVDNSPPWQRALETFRLACDRERINV